MSVRVYHLLLSVLFIFGTLAGCDDEAAKEAAQAAKNKEIVLKAFEAMNRWDLEEVRTYIGDDYVRHCQATPEFDIKSADEFLVLMEGWKVAVPDAVQTVHFTIAEGDMVGFWVTFAGTHTGPMGQIPPTGKRIESETSGFHRLQNGKIVETWVTWDNLTTLKQLGLFPPPPAEKQ